MHCNARPCCVLPWHKCIRIANTCIAMQGRVTYFRETCAFTCIRIAKQCIAMQGSVTSFRAISPFACIRLANKCCNARPCSLLPWQKSIYMHPNCKGIHCNAMPCYVLPLNNCIRIAKICIAMQGRVTYFREMSAFTCMQLAKK